MSAKDPRKSLSLHLSPPLYAALGAYRRRHGAPGMSAAARRVLRGALGLVAENPADAPVEPPFDAARSLRVQLEAPLRNALRERDEDAIGAREISVRLQTRLVALGYLAATDADECIHTARLA